MFNSFKNVFILGGLSFILISPLLIGSFYFILGYIFDEFMLWQTSTVLLKLKKGDGISVAPSGPSVAHIGEVYTSILKWETPTYDRDFYYDVRLTAGLRCSGNTDGDRTYTSNVQLTSKKGTLFIHYPLTDLELKPEYTNVLCSIRGHYEFSSNFSPKKSQRIRDKVFSELFKVVRSKRTNQLPLFNRENLTQLSILSEQEYLNSKLWRPLNGTATLTLSLYPKKFIGPRFSHFDESKSCEESNFWFLMTVYPVLLVFLIFIVSKLPTQKFESYLD